MAKKEKVTKKSKLKKLAKRKRELYSEKPLKER